MNILFYLLAITTLYGRNSAVISSWDLTDKDTETQRGLNNLPRGHVALKGLSLFSARQLGLVSLTIRMLCCWGVGGEQVTSGARTRRALQEAKIPDAFRQLEVSDKQVSCCWKVAGGNWSMAPPPASVTGKMGTDPKWA